MRHIRSTSGGLSLTIFGFALLCILWANGSYVGSVVAADGRPVTLVYRGKFQLSADETTDQYGQRFAIIGLSGICYRGGDEFIAVMDNSNKLVQLSVTFNADGGIATAKVLGGLSIAHSRDYEGIAYTISDRNSVFLSNEATPPPPALYEYDLKTGLPLQTIQLPAVFASQIDNRGLESLTRRVDGREMWTANEEALAADGTPSNATTGSVVRLQRLTIEGNTISPAEQYAYVTDPVHAGIGQPVSSGLSDLVVLQDGTLLSLERSARVGVPLFETRIHQVDFSGATDISRGDVASGLIGKKYQPVKKSQLFASNKIGENLEGLCLGPKLSGGNHVLLGVVDSGDPISKNTLVAFELIVPREFPASTGMVVAGAAAVVLLLVVLAAALRSGGNRTATA